MSEVEITPRTAGVPQDLGAASLPGSKSHAQRALLLAAAGTQTVTLSGVPASRDVEVLAGALRKLGASVQSGAGQTTAGGWGRAPRAAEIDLSENGTALRLLGVVVPMLGGRVRIDGAPRLRERPLEAVFEILAQGGVSVSGDRLPVVLEGTPDDRWPASIRVDAATTTQPASGAMLGLALRCRGHGTPPATLFVRRPAAPGYLAITAEVLDAFGFDVALRAVEGGVQVSIADRTNRAPEHYDVPADASAMAFPQTLAVLHRRPLPSFDVGAHPDAAISEHLQRLAHAPHGAAVVIDAIARHPDSFPALAVAAAARVGETTLGPALALRHKESDRIAAMASGLRAAGVPCRELADSLVVTGPLPLSEQSTRIPTTDDHRVVMALALLGTLRPVALAHADAVGKSWPGYWEWLDRVASVRRTEADRTN